MRINQCILAGAALACLSWSLPSPAHAQTSEQFDLICTGTTKGIDTTRPWEARFSIDLKASKFCRHACEAAEAIAQVEPNKLVLQNKGPTTDRPEDRYDKITAAISRADGSYNGDLIIRTMGVVDTTTGSCTLASFTAFPATLF